MMHKAQVSTETRIYVHCPNCGERAGQIDDLVRGDWRPLPIETQWSCDHCGVPYRLRIASADDVKVEINAEAGTDVPCFHLLMMPPQLKPVYAIIRSKDYGRGGRDKVIPFEGAQYFYDEHTCPTNWTGDIKMLVSNGNGDPHGLFRYVSSIDVPVDLSDEDVEKFLHKSFPEAFDGAPSNKTPEAGK